MDELRDAHLAEGTYRTDAVLAWHRADVAADKAEEERALREAEQHSALAQEIGAYREALTEVAEARRRWNAATELDRRRAQLADTELRRRHPDIELPPLHPPEEPAADADAKEPGGPAPISLRGSGDGFLAPGGDGAARPTAHVEERRDPEPDAARGRAEPGAVPVDRGLGQDRLGTIRINVQAAVETARKAQRILAERVRQAEHEAELGSDDVMHRREAEAQREASARRTAVRQDPAPSLRNESLERDEPELEA